MEPSNWKEDNSEEKHSESVLRNLSFSPPRNQQTGRPLNQYERSYVYRSEDERLVTHHREIPLLSSNEFMAVRGESATIMAPTYQEETNPLINESEDLFDREMQCCDGLLAEVKGLRTEYQSTMDILQKLYENQKRLSEVTSCLLKNSKPNYNAQIETSNDLPASAQVNDQSIVNHGRRGRDPIVNHGRHGRDHSHSLQENCGIDYGCQDYRQQVIDCGSSYGPDNSAHSSLLTAVSTNIIIDDETTTSCDEPDHTSNDSSIEFYSDSESRDAFGSHGVEAIQTMWDDFSVDDYVPSSAWVSQAIDTTTAGTKREWRPKITIPKPFSMTLREEQKEKKKSKTLLEIEREKLEKEALEEAELNKLFRANPVPATTHLPLYEMINAQHEYRRQQVKENSHKSLKAKERPFSFMERELKKMAAKEKEMTKKLEQEHDKMFNTIFKAQPIPRNVLDPNIDEKYKEDEEYRKIRIRMRSLELLANSHLPNRMKYNASNYSVGQLRRLRQEEMDKMAFLTTEHSFHPTVNRDVPDHKRSYEHFQNQLREKKKEDNMLTVTQPFTHRTDSRILERQSSKIRWSTTAGSMDVNVKPSKTAPNVSKSCLKSSSKQPTLMTHSAQLQHHANLHKLYKQEELRRRKQ